MNEQVCGSNDSAAMPAAKRSTSVTPELKLRNPLYTGNKACKQEIYPDLKSRGELSRISKQWFQWHHKNEQCPLKLLK